MNPVRIKYRIKLSETESQLFSFKLDGTTFDLIKRPVSDPPAWAELSFKQCSHCPLDPETEKYCPVALQLHDIVRRFHGTRSIDDVRIDVVTEERRVVQVLDIQRAIASILDLVLPICGCPKTAWMKPLARFHLPLASEEETVFRVTGMYLLAQYFVSLTSDNVGIQFDGLTRIYEDLHTLNAAIASRLQNATQSDSVKNAITLIDMYSMLVPTLLEDQLVEMQGFFEAYLPKTERKADTPKHLEQAKAFRLDLDSFFADEMEIDERPEWLKTVARGGEKEQETEKKEPAAVGKKDEEQQAIIASILGKSSLNLELEPLEEAEEDESKEEVEEGGAKSTKAVFKLSDD